MDRQKVCFILCANDEFLAEECLLYIRQLKVPEGFAIDTKVVYGAKSMAAGYNKAMQESDAKYKVYLHQDVLLIYRKFLLEILSLFISHPQVGMLGAVGNASLAPDGWAWSDGMHRRIGRLYVDLIYKKDDCIFSKIQGEYQEAVVLDGLLIATQYDLPWREDLFHGWDFYDCSQSLEFWKAGYQVVVPHMDESWCLHDNDILNMDHYEKWRTVFEREYGKYYKDWEKWRKTKWGKVEYGKKVIYQKFDKTKTLLDFPYPPICQEQGVDYICFTDDKTVRSKFWKVQYVGDFEQFDMEGYLAGYTEQCELCTNQIQIGSMFCGEYEWEKIISVPSLEEIPEVSLEKEKMASTSDEHGDYIYQRNPEYINGKYHGRPLLLTIGVPVSNQMETIGRCLSHIKPLLEELDSELLVIDTGSTDGTVSVCKDYGARVIPFPWCDNMSAARNEGIRNARGEWYLSIDDDEWFEDVGDILEFFKSGFYQKCDVAMYIQRNYQFRSGIVYHDNHTMRMARITPELHFEGRIHDMLIVPKTARGCALSSYVHHYGFVSDEEKRMKEKYIRNASILLYDVLEYPKNLRYNFQLANELKCQGYLDEAVAYFFRGLSMELELPDEYIGRIHAVNLLACLHDAKDKRMFTYMDLLKKRFELTEAENAFLSYCQAEMAVWYRRSEDEVLDYCNQYEKYRKRFEKNPENSQGRTFIGLHTCTNELYFGNIHVIAFCAYVRKEEAKKAQIELEKIHLEKIMDYRKPFLEHVMLSGEAVYGKALEKAVGKGWEEWQEELMDAFLVSICNDDLYKRQFVRFPEILQKFSVQGIENYLKRFYQKLTEKMEERLYQYSMKCKNSDSPLQELFLCGYVLKEQYVKAGKKERDMELFLQYVNVSGAFVSLYYNPALLEDFGCHAIPADLRAVYAIYLTLQDGKRSRQNIRNLKKALELFPGFKSEIQYLLERMAEPELGAGAAAASLQDEMAVLARTLKKQIAALIENAKYGEAKPMLQELSSYFPQDQEIQEMLEKVK